MTIAEPAGILVVIGCANSAKSCCRSAYRVPLNLVYVANLTRMTDASAEAKTFGTSEGARCRHEIARG